MGSCSGGENTRLGRSPPVARQLTGRACAELLTTALIGEIEREPIPAVEKILDAAPASIRARKVPVDDARAIFAACLDTLITRLARRDATPHPRLTTSTIARHLKSAADFASLTQEFLAVVDRLHRAMLRAHAAEMYTNRELMAGFIANAARRLRGTGRAHLGAIHEGFIELLEEEEESRRQRADVRARAPVRERQTEREREREQP